jgi:hypothetical protein
VPSDLRFATSVATGSKHTCVITSYAALRCWGSNEFGQLTVPAGVYLGEVTHLAAGWDYTCAAGTGTGGKLVCWGGDLGGAPPVPADLGPLA